MEVSMEGNLSATLIFINLNGEICLPVFVLIYISDSG